MLEEKKKEILSVVIANNTKPKEYLDYLGIFYDVVVINSSDVKDSKEVDLLLFTGGVDVDPDQYNESVGKYTTINTERDALEIDNFYKFRGKPKLGICRGSQLLTVLAGGSLIQHVEGHTKEHLIYMENYGSCLMPSTHHQMMYPFNMRKEKYILHSWASKYQSTTYLNGDNEEIDISKDFLEPEIVEYPEIKAFCIQGHPENGNDEIKDLTLRMFDNFLKKIQSTKSPYVSRNSIFSNMKNYDDYGNNIQQELQDNSEQLNSLKIKNNTANRATSELHRMLRNTYSKTSSNEDWSTANDPIFRDIASDVISNIQTSTLTSNPSVRFNVTNNLKFTQRYSSEKLVLQNQISHTSSSEKF